MRNWTLWSSVSSCTSDKFTVTETPALRHETTTRLPLTLRWNFKTTIRRARPSISLKCSNWISESDKTKSRQRQRSTRATGTCRLHPPLVWPNHPRSYSRLYTPQNVQAFTASTWKPRVSSVQRTTRPITNFYIRRLQPSPSFHFLSPSLSL